jgi:hypothetical protein
MSSLAMFAFALALSASTPAPEATQPGAAAADDTCGAAKYQYLIGQPKSAIPATPSGVVWRVYSTTEMVTMDYIEARMDIVWDADTGKVVKVKCG